MFSRHDPVCGAKVNKNTEYSLEHEGKAYYFHGQACMATFKENPGRFIKKGNWFFKSLIKGNKEVPKCGH